MATWALFLGDIFLINANGVGPDHGPRHTSRGHGEAGCPSLFFCLPCLRGFNKSGNDVMAFFCRQIRGEVALVVLIAPAPTPEQHLDTLQLGLVGGVMKGVVSQVYERQM
ncbi:hypothetical protein VB005_04576 [Metarhizium brunneum]